MSAPDARTARALEALHALARPIAAPLPLPATGDGPLAGLSIAVKDNVAVGGLPHEGASPALAGHVATRDAGAVARLRSAGASVAMQTNLHELAFGITSANAATGTVLNPWDARRVAGGSSGGTAAAVALGAVDAGLGTDTGGSGRIPAALCGCAGLRPTTGRYPSDGVLTLSTSLDTVSAMARTVATLAAVDAVLADDDVPAEPVPPADIVLGVAAEPFWRGASKEIRTRSREAVRRLERIGVWTLEVDDPGLARAATIAGEIALPLVLAETARFWRAFARDALGLEIDELVARVASEDVAGIFAAAASAPEDEAAYRDLVARRDEARDAMDGLWARRGVDALVHPANPTRAPSLDELGSIIVDGEARDTFATFTDARLVASITATPAIALPTGLDAARLPLGLELVARAGADRRLLGIAATAEAAFEPLPAPPDTASHPRTSS